MNVFFARPSSSRYLVPAVVLLCVYILSGCEPILYGTALTSAVSVNEVDRHTLPSLEGIDRVDVQDNLNSNYKYFDASTLTNPQVISDLVALLNGNRFLWKTKLQIVPESPSLPPPKWTLTFWSNQKLVRTVNVDELVLTTQFDSKTIFRKISTSDSNAISRLLEARVGWVEHRDTHR